MLDLMGEPWPIELTFDSDPSISETLARAVATETSVPTWYGNFHFNMSPGFSGELEVLRSTFTVVGQVTGTGEFRKTGSGTFRLNGDAAGFSGDSDIIAGVYVLDNQTSSQQAFGNGVGNFTIRSGATTTMTSQTILNVDQLAIASGGKLEVSPTSVVQMNSLSLATGSQLVFDATQPGTIGTVVILSGLNVDKSGKQNPVFYKGISGVAEGDYSRVLVFGTGVGGPTQEEFSTAFGTPLVDPSFVHGGLSVKALTTYATETGVTDPDQLAQVEQLESQRLSATGLQRDYFDILYNAISPNPWDFDLPDALVDSQTQVLPDVLGGMVASRPVGQIVLWRQIDARAKKGGLVASSLIRGQSCCGPAQKKECSCRRCASKQRDYWGQAYHSSLQVRGNFGFDGYGVSRTGFVFGVNSALTDRTSGGIVFAHSQPYLYDRNERVDLFDYQFGAHLESALGDHWEVGFWLGGGAQSNSAVRYETFNVQTYRFDGDFTGNTLSATALLSRVYEVGKRTSLRPTIAVDSEHAWFHGFDEYCDVAEANRGGSLNLALRHYNGSYYGRTLARVGVMGQTNFDRMGINYKAFYGSQLGGSDSPEASVVLVDGMLPTYSQTLRGAPLGRDFFNFGVGGFCLLNKKGNWLLFGDYSATLFTHATTQVATLGSQITW